MFRNEIEEHYVTKWSNTPAVKKWDKGPVAELPHDFCILEFSPTPARNMWTYATCGMSQPSDAEALELHLFSPQQTEMHVELLTVIAHYHRTGQALGHGHTVNFGRPWLAGSACDYGLISLPYLDGPEIEHCPVQQGRQIVSCLWLIPITVAERNHKKIEGLESLERKFDEASLNYLDPFRFSVV